MKKIYKDKDASLNILKKRTIGILGYGNQGRGQSLNMRDSGLENIIVGNRDDEYLETARDDGFKTYSITDMCKKADIIFMLVPDEIAPDIYKKKVEPYLKTGDVLNFASGYNITFGHIKLPEEVDVTMVAPRMIGEGVREKYLNDDGFPSFIAVEQDFSGKAKEISLALAKAIGSTRMGAIEVEFKDETYLDLIAEQATWPLILSVFTEVFKFEKKLGIPEEAILMELYLSKEPALMLEKMADVGLYKQMPMHSHTSQYGQLSRFQEVNKEDIRSFIEKQFENIQSGKFAEEWKQEQENGLNRFQELMKEALNSAISKAEDKVKKNLDYN